MPTLLAVLDLERGYGREVARGLLAAAQAPWQVRLVPISRFRRADLDGADAVIAQGWPGVVRRLVGCRVPVVNVSSARARRWPQVAVDETAVGRLAAQHLVARGAKLIAVIGGSTIHAERTAACVRTARALGCAVLRGPAGTPSASLLERWLQRCELPLAVFAHDDVVAQTLAQALRAAGRRLGHDVQLLVGADDELACAAHDPPLAVVQLPTRAIGRLAVEQLSAGAVVGAQLAPLGVVERSSLGPSAGAAAGLLALIADPRQVPSVAAWACRAGLGRRALERALHAGGAEPPAAALRAARIALARQLLLHGQLSMAAIATRCGFSSAARFSQAFAAATGVAPSLWRARNA